MNKLFISTASAIILGALTFLSSCTISSYGSSSIRNPKDDVEVTEGKNGVKTITVKRKSSGRQPVVTTTNGVTTVEYDGTSGQSVGNLDWETVTHTYNVRQGWKTISVAGVVDVEYTPSTSYSPIKLTCPEWLMNYVKVDVKGEELSISLKNAAIQGNRNLQSPMKVTLSAPAPQAISVSGVASVTMMGDMNVKGSFSTLLSGASSITLRGVQTSGDVNWSLSGASSLNVNKVRCANATFSPSGASSITVKDALSANSVQLDPSGASSITIKGTCSSVGLSVEGSGASSLDLKGFNGSWMNMEISGASSGKIEAVTAKSLEVLVNGASNAHVKMFNGTILNVDVQGVSSAEVANITATNVNAEVGFECKVTLGGTTERTQLKSSNGQIDASNLKADKAYVAINGGNAHITVKSDKIYTDE